MSRMRSLCLPTLVAAAWLVSFGCDEGGSGKDRDAGDTDDTDSQTEDTEETEIEGSWEDVGLELVRAPDETTILVRFDGNPPEVDAADPESYEVTSDKGGLVVESVDYDLGAGEATLTTEKQKLGITYTLSVVAQDAPQGLEESFPSADTATFWASDFASGGYEQYQVTASRDVVGEHSVIYIENGWGVSGTDVASADFDSKVYPLETEMFAQPDDIDGNGKIVILGLDGGGYYGGYFSGVNAYPDEQTYEYWGIHSNEMEMIHVNVAGGGAFDADGGIIPHEFQHLLHHAEHSFTEWNYHNEGLSESAVRLVNGDYPYAIWFYFEDYQGKIGDGEVSLVNWTYAQYENYVVAFLFFAYIASQLDGVDTYGDIFDLPTGEPGELDDLLVDQMGLSFDEVQLDELIALWKQDATGPQGFNGFLDLGGQRPPRVDAGTTSVDLQPFASAFFPVAQDTVDYPGTQGSHIVYVGIDAAGNVDEAAPFDKAGGVLIMHNANMEWSSYPSEHSGPDIAASSGSKLTALALDLTDPVSSVFDSGLPATWFDPPPIDPTNPEPFLAWQRATAARLAACPL